MKNILITLLIFLISNSANTQDLGKLIESENISHHENVDSIICIKYMNANWGDEPHLVYKYKGVEYNLFTDSKSVYEYKDPYNLEIKNYGLLGELSEIKTMAFNEQGYPTKYKLENLTSEMFNEEKLLEYNDNNRLTLKIRTGYDALEYEAGNKELSTDSVAVISYGENNLVESAKIIMEMGIQMSLTSEPIGDTLRYTAEVKMTGPFADMMGGAMDQKEHVMDIYMDSESKKHVGLMKDESGKIIKEYFDKEGQPTERISMTDGEISLHQKFTYENGQLIKTEILKGAEDYHQKYNAQGKLKSEATMMGQRHYNYDERGNLIEEILLDDVTLELQEITIYKYYYKN